MENNFLSCGPKPLGLYPVVDRAAWLQKLLPLGVTTIQLRIKDLQNAALEEEIAQAVMIAKNYQARLFINDYWELAIKYHAYGVHLGQEDLSSADITLLRTAGLRLGISTHSDAEISRAEAIKPSYVAFGPIFSTTSKIMPFDPQGIEKLTHRVQNSIYPVVAIGGINLARLPGILTSGADGIALISAITQAADPISATKDFLAVINKFQESDNTVRDLCA